MILRNDIAVADPAGFQMKGESKMIWSNKNSMSRCGLRSTLHFSCWACHSLRNWAFAQAQEPPRRASNTPTKSRRTGLPFTAIIKGWSYSPLNQITRENVKRIVPVWAFPAGFPTGTAGLRPGLEAAPLVVDGVLYLEGMQNNVYASRSRHRTKRSGPTNTNGRK